MRSARILTAMTVLAAVVVGRPAAAQQVAPWTVLVYLQGNTPPSLASLEDASIIQFNELEQVGSSPNVNVVCQWQRSTTSDQLDVNYGGDTTQSFTTCRRYLVTRDPNQQGLDPTQYSNTGGIRPNPTGNPVAPPGAGFRIWSAALQDLGTVDMGQEQTLIDFVTWGIQRFPARHYLLIMSDSGQGWQPRAHHGTRGLMFDPGAGTGIGTFSYFTQANVRSAMSRIKALNGNQNLDALVLDCDGAGVLEVSYQVRDSVNYVMGPALRRPTGGFPYHLWLQRLASTVPTDNTTIETMLNGYAGDFLSAYNFGTPLPGGVQSTAVSVYRTAQLPAVATAADNLAKAILANVPNAETPMLRALSAVQTGRATDFSANYVDLVDLATQITAQVTDTNLLTAASRVAPAVTAAMVNSNQKVTNAPDLNVDNFHGVMVYFPTEPSSLDTTYNLSGDFVTNTSWDEMVQGVLTLNSNTQGPLITIAAPISGSTIIDTTPQIVATIVDQNQGGRVNPQSITLAVDGVPVANSALSYDTTNSTLTYQIPSPLSVTSHTFTITASNLSGISSTATGSFRITVMSLAAGIQTFSLPRRLTAAQNAPGTLFGTDGFSLARWVPLLFGTSKYKTYPDPYATFIPPDCASTLTQPTVPQPPAGLAYWLRMQQSRPLPSLPGSEVTLTQYPIQLYKNPDGGPGWNMIGNPYDIEAIGMAAAMVRTTSGNVITFQQAIDQNLTPGVLFSYTPNSTNPNAAGQYDFGGAGQGQLTRLQGYWLRANSNFTLLISNGLAGSTASRAATAVAPASGWNLVLRADGVDGTWDQARLGASRETTDSFDRRWDVAAPPALPGGVAVRFVHPDWGVESGRYIRDLRSEQPTQAWDVAVTAPAGEVTLSWPALRNLPADLNLVLTDLATGTSRSLRSTASYRFNHQGGDRALKLVATRRQGGGLDLGPVTVTAGRGAGYGVAFTLNRDAQLQVVVRSLGGRTVRQLTGASRAAGRGELFWDGRGADGALLPNGLYQLELIATADDGTTVRTVRTVRVVR